MLVQDTQKGGGGGGGEEGKKKGKRNNKNPSWNGNVTTASLLNDKYLKERKNKGK